MKNTRSKMFQWRTGLALTAALFIATPTISAAQTVERFDYDALGRLIRVQTPTSTTVYSYDAAGNRSVVSVTSSSLPSAAKRRVVVVPSGAGFMIIPLN
nr:RHS repeat domain-containing protein [uncultured Brevundimonas sp.]